MAVTRERSRRGEGARLRQEILDAVNELLDEWGSVEQLTIRAVANAVGVSAPSIYLQFRDKAELIWAALADKYEQLAAEMDRADKAVVSADPLEHLRAQLHAYCRFGLRNPGKYRLMFESRQPQVAGSRMLNHPAGLVSGSLRRATRRCKDAGALLALPSDDVAHLLWVGMHGELSLLHSLLDGFDSELVLKLVDALLDSLVVPAATGFRDASARTDGTFSEDVYRLLGGDAPAES